MKARSIFVSVLILLALLLVSCQPAATPAAPGAPAGDDPCASDPLGCAKIPAGGTIKIGMGAPMTGDNAQFGVDISQGAMIAIADGGDVEGFKFELVVEDDGGTPEGGASVANKLVSDPTIVAVAGHIFSGATDAAIEEKENPGTYEPEPKCSDSGILVSLHTCHSPSQWSE